MSTKNGTRTLHKVGALLGEILRLAKMLRLEDANAILLVERDWYLVLVHRHGCDALNTPKV